MMRWMLALATVVAILGSVTCRELGTELLKKIRELEEDVQVENEVEMILRDIKYNPMFPRSAHYRKETNRILNEACKSLTANEILAKITPYNGETDTGAIERKVVQILDIETNGLVDNRRKDMFRKVEGSPAKYYIPLSMPKFKHYFSLINKPIGEAWSMTPPQGVSQDEILLLFKYGASKMPKYEGDSDEMRDCAVSKILDEHTDGAAQNGMEDAFMKYEDPENSGKVMYTQSLSKKRAQIYVLNAIRSITREGKCARSFLIRMRLRSETPVIKNWPGMGEGVVKNIVKEQLERLTDEAYPVLSTYQDKEAGTTCYKLKV